MQEIRKMRGNMRGILPLCQSIAAHRFSSDSHLDDNTRAIQRGQECEARHQTEHEGRKGL